MEGTNERRHRVNRLKKIILGMIVTAIVIPITGCILLLVYICSLQREMVELKLALESKQEVTTEVSGIYTTARIEEVAPKQETIEQTVSQENIAASKQIYLTFDDGPSTNTDRILDILKEYDVKATFFVVGKTDTESIRLYRRIVSEGHTLGMHSYSHKYHEIYESLDSFKEDLSKLQEYLYQITDVWPRVYRFPGGSSNTVSNVPMKEFISYLNQNDIMYMDWNIASGDAANGYVSKDSIINGCISQIDELNECVILMHDATQKNTTVEALPEIISQIQGRGDAVFLPVTDGTVPVWHVTANE